MTKRLAGSTTTALGDARSSLETRRASAKMLFAPPREDEMNTLSASVHNRAFTRAGFSPRISIIREERETNAQALDYKRNRAEFSFVRQF